MAKRSAGLLVWREGPTGIEFLLAHPGGPFFAKKDDAAWSIPKGLIEDGEDPETAARREFAEETGQPSPDEPALSLGEIRQKGGKTVMAWLVRGDFDPGQLRSNSFELQWPPRSGKRHSFPEIDRVGWFSSEAARRKLNPAQAELIDRALEHLGGD